MLFLAVIVSWFAMQYWGGAAVFQRDSWLRGWSQWLEAASIAQYGGTLTMLVLLIVPAFLVALVLHLFGAWLFGLLAIAINIIALLFACGRGDCSADVAAYRDALCHRDESTVYNTVYRVFGHRSDSLALLHCRIRSTVAYHNYERWFAPVIWFLLLGAPGAVFYRCSQLLAKMNVDDTSLEAETDASNFSQQIQENANALLAWLDWLPVRMWGFLFALAADFNRVYHVLGEQMHQNITTIELLDAINLASLHSDDVYDGACFSVGESSASTDVDVDREKLKVEMMAIDSINKRVMVVGLLMVSLLTIIF